MSSTALPLLFLLSTMSGCLGMEGGKEAAALEDRHAAAAAAALCPVFAAWKFPKNFY